MLHIIQSNRMEALQKQFTTLLNTARLTNPFDVDVVLVQSPGMAQWLKVGLCRDLGIAAQVDFPLPSSFIWRLYQQLLPDVPDESPYNKPNMTWKLLTLLPTCLDEPLYAPLKQYLKDDSARQKLFALCEKIADVFDQYLMYRPRWLEQWEAGSDALTDVDVELAPWQPDLWRRLVAHTQALGQSHYHRANMQQRLLEALEQSVDLVLPERICIFGISALPQSQLAVFEALAKKTEVLLFFFNPSEHYWGDLVDEKTRAKIEARYALKPEIDAEAERERYFMVGNPLLSSWGKLGRDYFEQLLQLDARWIDGFVTDFNDTLLSQIQHEIYQLAFKGESLSDDTHWFISNEGRLAVDISDTSVRLADCHTALREVEALHDYLLGLFEADPSLTPKDIIVMMPDVGSYSPYIEAVFGGAAQARFIPYAIADLAIDQERPVLTSFIRLSELPFSRFGVSEILDLLQVGPIADKFAVQEHEIALFAYWLEQVGVKWGLSGEHKGEYGLPTLDLNTWQQGLRRLLLGVALRDENTPFNGVYAADQVEGMAQESFDKLLSFVDALAHYKSVLGQDATLSEKAVQLKQLLQDFFDTEQEQGWDLLLLGDLIERFELHYASGDHQQAVSQRVICQQLKQGVREKGVGQRFWAGSVNFCTLMPMRAVPFKVVCMLGLNDADYPRTVQPVGFDLVPHSIRQKGDRSRKLDDRYLFLEALLSAREKLYLSYVGHSCFDNEKRMPSILVSELMEYVARSFYCPGSDTPLVDLLTTEHALQPFNPDYYTPGPWQSFNPVWLQNEEIELTEPEALATEVENEIEVLDLLATLLKPQQVFYQRIIGLRLVREEALAEDEEPFSLDALSRYGFLDEILSAKLGGDSLNREQWLQRGALPQASLGTLTLNTLEHRVDGMASRLKGLGVGDEPQRQEIDLTLCIPESEGKVRLVGWLSNCFDNRQVFYRSASVKAKDFIAAYLYHLMAAAQNSGLETWLVGLDEVYRLRPVEPEEALSRLQAWLGLYSTARTRPVAFFPVSALAYAKSGDMAKAETAFSGGRYIGSGEGEDPYIALDHSTLAVCEEEFIGWSQTLITPLLDVLEEITDADA